MNMEIAKRIISETGAKIDEARKGNEAVEMFKNHPFDYYYLIFMNIQMSIMNGYEAIEEMRSMGRPD